MASKALVVKSHSAGDREHQRIWRGGGHQVATPVGMASCLFKGWPSTCWAEEVPYRSWGASCGEVGPRSYGGEELSSTIEVRGPGQGMEL